MLFSRDHVAWVQSMHDRGACGSFWERSAASFQSPTEWNSAGSTRTRSEPVSSESSWWATSRRCSWGTGNRPGMVGIQAASTLAAAPAWLGKATQPLRIPPGRQPSCCIPCHSQGQAANLQATPTCPHQIICQHCLELGHRQEHMPKTIYICGSVTIGCMLQG